MGILAAFDQSIQAEIDSANPPGPLDDYWYDELGLASDSGIRITPQGALNISTVWKCIGWWFRVYGTLPHKLKERRLINGRLSQIDAVDHDLYDLIHAAPNPSMTSEYFHGLIPVDKFLHGAFYAFILRNPTSGKIESLWRLRPDMVKMKVINKQLWYIVTGDDGLPVKFYPDEILHLPAISHDGRTGLSAIKANHNVLAWNRATTRYGAQFFKNASRPSGIISTQETLQPEARKDLIANLRRSGKEAGKLLLIEGAATFSKMTLDQDEAQFILTCEMQADDLCGDFFVFPHEIGISRNANNSITEQLTINTVTRNLTPFCIQTEQQMNLQLLSNLPSSGIGGGTERSRYFFQSELKSLLRGDTAAQTAHLKAMRDLGIFDGDDCADFLGMPPFKGGDLRVINGAYVPLDMLPEIAKNRRPGDVGAPNGPGGDPPTDNKRNPDSRAPVLPAWEARLRKSYLVLFADAVGRVTSRKKSSEREKYVSVFRAPIAGLAKALAIPVNAEFLEDYVGGLGKRALHWEDTDSVKISALAEDELTRAIDALIEHGQQAEYLEGVVCDA